MTNSHVTALPSQSSLKHFSHSAPPGPGAGAARCLQWVCAPGGKKPGKWGPRPVGLQGRTWFLSGFRAKHGAGMPGSIWPWPWVSEAAWRLNADTRSLSQQHRAEPAPAAAFTSSSATLCCGKRARGTESPGPIPASQQEESPLVSGACSIYTAYRGGFCLPRHWKMLHMGGQPHQSCYFYSP